MGLGCLRSSDTINEEFQLCSGLLDLVSKGAEGAVRPSNRLVEDRTNFKWSLRTEILLDMGQLR
jgi:hypothetical protein